MNKETLWLLFIAVGLGTFMIRLSFIHLYGTRISNIDRYKKTLQLLAPAILASLCAPPITYDSRSPTDSFDLIRIFSACITIIIAWRFKGIFWPIVTGMTSLLVMQTYFTT